MKNVPVGSCWYYWPEDRSIYAGQIGIVIHSHEDALGDYEYEVWMMPNNRVFDVQDNILSLYFKEVL